MVILITNCDITIFNRYVENRENKFKKAIIKNVHWEDSKGANILQSGLQSIDESVIYIPFSSVPDYIKPSKFKEMIFLGTLQGVTIQEEDIIVKGIIEEDEHFRSVKDLENKYDDVRVVTSVDTMDYGSPSLQHWEVGAK